MFRNLDAVLRAGASNPNLVVNTTVLVADVSSFAELNELFGEFFLRESAGAHDDAGSAPAGPADLDRMRRRVTPAYQPRYRQSGGEARPV